MTKARKLTSYFHVFIPSNMTNAFLNTFFLIILFYYIKCPSMSIQYLMLYLCSLYSTWTPFRGCYKTLVLYKYRITILLLYKHSQMPGNTPSVITTLLQPVEIGIVLRSLHAKYLKPYNDVTTTILCK